MNNISFFELMFIPTIPLGIILIILFMRNNKLVNIMRQFDQSYARFLYDIFDISKILRVYFGKEKIKAEDKKYLKHTLGLFAISWITFLIWAIIIIKYYDVILD